ncbi:hypothetical protein H6P81_008004 [Aristolochia fimbriata]|uniref:Uncharacterized protein n=1 Tax=Aristolochia fimbriata TaxID=158543 RepID=A0AAV7F1S8_ARIFI|nr:hypothetical protein H6P81_008004 [Aristolochia fimbriata]
MRALLVSPTSHVTSTPRLCPPPPPPPGSRGLIREPDTAGPDCPARSRAEVASTRTRSVL